jgi:hypothetical protein
MRSPRSIPASTARLQVRDPHDLRHSYATMLLMDHYSPAYVQKQLAHRSISITVDLYVHLIPGEGRKDPSKTLLGPKARPGQTLTMVTGAKLGRNWDSELKQKAQPLEITP